MASPTGDLPDFDTLTSPAFVTKALTNVQASGSQTLVVSGNPTRLWQVWVSVVYQSTAAYSGAGNGFIPSIQDGNGNIYLAAESVVAAANQIMVSNQAIPMYGIPVPLIGGTYGLFLIMPSIAANTVARVSAGVVYSQP